MSDLGAQIDQLIIVAQAAIPTVQAERGPRLSSDLLAEEFPHLSVVEPRDAITLLDHQQEAVEAQIRLVFATRGETQEALLLKIGAFRENLRAVPDLGGIVDYAYVSEISILEYPVEEVLKEGIVIVTTLRERF
mgnify:CR=1